MSMSIRGVPARSGTSRQDTPESQTRSDAPPFEPGRLGLGTMWRPGKRSAGRPGGPNRPATGCRRYGFWLTVGPADAATVWMNPWATCGTVSWAPSRISWIV